MKKYLVIIVIVVACLWVSFSPEPAWAGCTLSHIECKYTCIEYYPNGVDCKKTKKECETVCDEYDVKISGDTPHTGISVQQIQQPIRKGVIALVKVSGIIDQVFAIGGETTGWSIKLDDALEITKGLEVSEIEVDSGGMDVVPFRGQHVEVTGKLFWQEGIERGSYPVIVIESIKVS